MQNFSESSNEIRSVQNAVYFLPRWATTILSRSTARYRVAWWKEDELQVASN